MWRSEEGGAGRVRGHLGDRVDHAARSDRGVKGADGLDVAVRVVAWLVVCGAGGRFVLSLPLRDGTDHYRTYSTTTRGVDRLMFDL